MSKKQSGGAESSGDSKRQETPCALWDVTIPADLCTIEQVQKALQSFASKWVFQLEKGAETGHLHYQVRYSLGTKRHRQKQAWKTWLDLEIKISEHSITKTCNRVFGEGEESKRFSYVMKTETRQEGPWSDKKPWVHVLCNYDVKEFLPFQRVILDSALYYEARKLNIVLDLLGGLGKSTAGYWASMNGGLVLPGTLTDAKDMMQYVCSMLESKKMTKITNLIVDMPRARNKDRLHGLWSALETIKSGHVYDTRNKAREIWIEVNNIWVFTNKLPEMEDLSADRWRIWEFDESRTNFKHLYFSRDSKVASVKNNLKDKSERYKCEIVCSEDSAEELGTLF